MVLKQFTYLEWSSQYREFTACGQAPTDISAQSPT